MASVVRLDRPRRGVRLALMAVDFTPRPGARRFRARLGRCSLDDARRFAAMVEKLTITRRHGLRPDAETGAWIARLPANTRALLERSGLVDPASKLSADPTLRRVCAAHLRARRRELSRGGRDQARLMVRSLVSCFGENPRIDRITRDDARRWWMWMREHLAEATARGRVRYANVMFGPGMHGAVGLGLLAENPFDQLPRASLARDKDDVSRDRVLAVMDQAPPAMRATLALARFAGLRVPSETHGLTWERVDFERGVLRVWDVKRSRERLVPMEPLLQREMVRAQESAREGAVRVIDASANNLRQTLARAQKRAGEAGWSPPFHALRASCEIDWMEGGHSVADVAAWIGHSMAVCAAHYAKARPGNMERVTGRGAAKSAAVDSSRQAHRAETDPRVGHW